MTQAIFPRAQVWGDVAAFARADAAHARRFFATHADRGSVIGSPGTDFITAGGRLFDSWPASPDENLYTRVRNSSVETLLIGGRLDVATPPQNATRKLLPHLSNGHEVVLPDIGHTDDFWTYQTPAEQPPDQHLPRQRPGRHVALHANVGRLHAGARPRPHREYRPRRDAGAGRADGALAGVHGASRAVARSLWTQEQRRAPRPCFRSCSVWAACSSAS